MKYSTVRPLILWTVAFWFIFSKTYPFLPEIMATKFDLSGNAIDHMSKSFYLQFMIFIVAILNLSFFGTRLLINESTFRKWINVPMKEHWLSDPELIKQAMKNTDRLLYWGGTGLNLIMVLAHCMLMNINGIRTLVNVSLNGFLITTAIFAIVYLVWTIRLFRVPNL